MMRIAYVCTDPGIPVYGGKGSSLHVQAVLRELVRRGAEVHLIAARLGGPAPRGLEQVDAHQLPVAVKEPDAAAREVAAQRCDGQVATMLGRLPALDLVYERYALWGRTATAWAAAAGVPSVLEVNAPLPREQADHRVLVDAPTAQAVAVAALSAASSVVCVSEQVASWARTVTADPGRVTVVGNGVDTERITPATRPVTPAGAPLTIGFVGSLKAWHGVEVLIDAVAAMPAHYRLLLVGDGPQAASLAQRTEAMGLAGRVEMTGAVDPDLVAGQLHRMDIAVAPYPSAQECYFSPLKLYEYLAAGLPIVASDVGELPQVLDGGRLGVLAPAGDPSALAAALGALGDDPSRRALLGRRARGAALARHTWAHVVDRILAGLPHHAGVR